MDRIFHPSTERISSKREPSLGYRAYRTGGSLHLTPVTRQETTRSGDGETRTVAKAFRQVEKAQDTAAEKISSPHIEFEGTTSTIQNKAKEINAKIERLAEEEVYKIFRSLNYKETYRSMDYVTEQRNIIHGHSLKDILIANKSDLDYFKRYYTRGKIASSKSEQYKWIPQGRIFNKEGFSTWSRPGISVIVAIPILSLREKQDT